MRISLPVISKPIQKLNIEKSSSLPEWYYITILSNFAKGYDKYSRCYSKQNIPESTFPDKFFLLKPEELNIGIAKNLRLLEKLNLKGNRLIALKTRTAENETRTDHPTGLGQYISQNHIDIESVYFININENKIELESVIIEDIIAKSHQVLGTELIPWNKLTPRSISILPIAMACQADCKFCFSKASASSEFEGHIHDWDRIQTTLQEAKNHGAERVVITGGGEPTLLKSKDLLRLVHESSKVFSKVVLINNGYKLASIPLQEQLKTLLELDEAGLNTIAISRHHHNTDKNTEIMGLDTLTETLIDTLTTNQNQFKKLKPRLICVLQKGGIDTEEELKQYLSWAVKHGVHEINFKELYVSTNEESTYSNHENNKYSAKHQVSLKLILDFAKKYGWEKVSELPWGSPIFKGMWNGKELQIAAYTEPSVYWERTHGIARSWNLMADGKLLASLEDNNSRVYLPMNYEQFKVFRDQVVTKPSVKRLDCMNLSKAMSHLLDSIPKPSTVSQWTTNNVIELWAKNMGIANNKDIKNYEKNIACASGVREILNGIFKLIAKQGKDLWLPDDVYPIYWKLAKEAGIKTNAFSTIPKLDLTFLNNTSKKSVVLLPNPITPLGRHLNDYEVEELKTWVTSSKERRLIIDAVYTFENQFDNRTLELWKTEQAFIAHSLSKSWLSSGVLGVALIPSDITPSLRNVLEPLTEGSVDKATQIMTSLPELPNTLKKVFIDEWKRLTPHIQQISPGFKPPETGYFSTIKRATEAILEKDSTLTIPASIFGSKDTELSIISCLYEIKQNNNAKHLN